MPTKNAVKFSPDSKERGLTLVESVTLKFPEDWLPEKKKGQDVETGPVITVNAVEDSLDGGLVAWSIVLGSACVTFATLGLVNTWGVFQSYYERVLIPETTTSAIAWIGSVQCALVYLPGLVSGRLFDLGYFNHTLFVFSVILVVAVVLTAECKEFWQLLLCQGFLTGICFGMIFAPIPAIISQWFQKRRSLVFGIVATGASLGGTVIPIAARNLIELVGFKWTMRFVALVELFMLTIANLTLKRRFEPLTRAGPFFAWHDFRRPAFNTLVLSGILGFLGLYTLLTYIDLSATRAGISPDFSFYLVSIANAVSSLGRIASGSLSDRFGAITVLGPLTLLCAVVTCLWPFATTKGAFIAVGIIYGFCSGAYVCLFKVPATTMGDPHDSGRRIGSFYTCITVGAIFGLPISGAIAQHTNGFRAVGYYAGSCIVGSFVLLYLTKYLVMGSLRGKY